MLFTQPILQSPFWQGWAAVCKYIVGRELKLPRDAVRHACLVRRPLYQALYLVDRDLHFITACSRWSSSKWGGVAPTGAPQ
jgi:hypothetical protein